MQLLEKNDLNMMKKYKSARSSKGGSTHNSKNRPVDKNLDLIKPYISKNVCKMIDDEVHN